MQCLSCFNAQLSNCAEGITINGGFTVGSTYKWVITDKFGNKYSGTEVATADGVFIAEDAAGLPSGFFEPYAGDFLLNFFDDTGKPFTVGICQEYECISIHILQNEPDLIETQIGVCDSGGGGCCGIDDVLAIGQPFTAARAIDITGNRFDISSTTDGAVFSNKLTITGGDNTEIANFGSVGYIKSQDLPGTQFGIVAVDKTKVDFGQTEGAYQFQFLVQQTDPATYKPLSVDSLGNVFKMDAWPLSPTPGIDSVLAVGQSLTANRTVNLNAFSWTFTASGASASGIVGIKQDATILRTTPDLIVFQSDGQEAGRIKFVSNVAGDAGDIYIGRLAGSSMITTDGRVLIGWRTGELATAASITGVGYEVLRLCTGSGNQGFGTQALHNITTGTQNVGVGRNTVLNATIINRGTFVGNLAGPQTWAGLQCDDNTFTGFSAGLAFVGGAFTAIQNTISGSQAAAQRKYGNSNSIYGYGAAGFTSSTDFGSNNNLFGANIIVGAIDNSSVIGQGITCTLSNVAILGRSDQNVIVGDTNPVADSGDKMQIGGTLKINTVNAGTGSYLGWDSNKRVVTLTQAFAKADGSTTGIAAFTAADFNDNGSGLISIDYSNGQAATTSQKGFLTSTDWNIFNGKESVLTFTTPGNTRSVNTITNDFITGKSGGLTAVGGTASGENLTLQSTTNATRGKIYWGSAQESFFDEVNKYLKIVTPSIGGAAPAATSGMYIVNTTASAAGAQQSSPGFTLEGRGWDSTNSLDKPVHIMQYALPHQAAGNPTVDWVLGCRINAGTFTPMVSFIQGASGSNSFNVFMPASGFQFNDTGGGNSTFIIGTNSLTAYMSLAATGGRNVFTSFARDYRIDNNAITGAFYISASTGQVGVNVTPSGNGRLQVLAGASSQAAKVGGSIFDHFADAGNTTTGETDLYSDTLPASIFTNNGDVIDARYAGTFVNNANTKTLRAYVAGTNVFNSGALTTTAGFWEIHVLAIRVSASVLRVTVRAGVTNAGTTTGFTNYTEITGLTLTNTQIVKITGQSSVATNDIVAKLSKMVWRSAA